MVPSTKDLMLWLFVFVLYRSKNQKASRKNRLVRLAKEKRSKRLTLSVVPSHSSGVVRISQASEPLRRQGRDLGLPLLYTMQLFLLSSTPCQVTSRSHLGPAVSTMGTWAFVFCRVTTTDAVYSCWLKTWIITELIISLKNKKQKQKATKSPKR